MRASALATQERLGGPGQWVLNLPPSYVAGVQVLYRSVVAGTEPVSEVEDLHRGTPLPLAGADATDPSAATAASTSLARFDVVLVGGGPLDPEVRAAGGGERASGSCRPTG